MRNQGTARIVFGLVSLTAAVGVVLSLYVASTIDSEQFTSAGARVVNQLFFFTILSNILVAVVFGLLAVRLDRPSLLFRVLWLAALVDIVVTGVVYYLVLDQVHETTLGLVASTILHAVVPIVAVVAAAVFGPRKMVSGQVAGLAMLVPLAWLVVTLVRGAIIDWYPYPFIDVNEYGYGRVLLNVLVMAAFFLALYGVALLVARARSGSEQGRGAATPAR